MHPNAIIWTPDMISALRHARDCGLPWDEAGDKIGVCGKVARLKAIELGLYTGPLNRGPVPGRVVVQNA